ncbi:MAG: TetR/AcrR family transcriptional regulator [Polyangiaceae bacterium]
MASHCQVPSSKRERIRRVPTQERSRKRVESILDAAAGVFAETGFEAATMESIAERAKTSIGSLYQFFPNKLAVFEAVAGRFIEGSRAMLEQLFGDGGADWSWEQLLDAALDRFGAQRDDLDFRAMLVNFQLYGVYAQADRALHGQAIDRVAALARRVAPHLPLAQRKLVATVTVETLSALLLHSTREEPSFAKKLLEETKTLLSRYLAPYMEAKG